MNLVNISNKRLLDKQMAWKWADGSNPKRYETKNPANFVNYFFNDMLKMGTCFSAY